MDRQIWATTEVLIHQICILNYRSWVRWTPSLCAVFLGQIKWHCLWTINPCSALSTVSRTAPSCIVSWYRWLYLQYIPRVGHMVQDLLCSNRVRYTYHWGPLFHYSWENHIIDVYDIHVVHIIVFIGPCCNGIRCHNIPYLGFCWNDAFYMM